MPKDIRTEAIVLHRTNYGEADRIINFLTPQGKKSALARGVRKEKSRLASGAELLCLSEITLHEKKDSGDGLNILTSARSKFFYQNILTDLEKLDLASRILKSASRLSDSIISEQLFRLTCDCLSGLNSDLTSLRYINIYYILNSATISGEQINLISTVQGDRLSPEHTYSWDIYEKAFRPDEKGDFTASHIKLLRLILSSNLETISRVKHLETYLPPLNFISSRYAELSKF